METLVSKNNDLVRIKNSNYLKYPFNLIRKIQGQLFGECVQLHH